MNTFNKRIKEKKCLFCNNLCSDSALKNIRKCGHCGIMFQNRDSSFPDPANLYNKDYFQGKVYKDYLNEADIRISLFRKKINLIKQYFPSKGRILDLGCAAGFFLKIMNELNYQTYGIEISNFASDYAQNKFHLNVIQGDLSNANFQDNFFQIITLWDVLEHLPNPREVLIELNRIMGNEGIMIIETVNTDSLNVKLMKNNWPLYSPDFHLFYYNKKFLINILDKAGFKIQKIIPIQTYFNIGKTNKTFRYFHIGLLRWLLGKLFDDVILIIARKKKKSTL